MAVGAVAGAAGAIGKENKHVCQLYAASSPKRGREEERERESRERKRMEGWKNVEKERA